MAQKVRNRDAWPAESRRMLKHVVGCLQTRVMASVERRATSSHFARATIETYLRDVRDRYKNDDRAKQCKQEPEGPVFRAVGETYKACQS